jgi:hypothetical protein
MEVNTSNTDNAVNTAKPSFVSTVKGLPIALAGEMVKQPARITMKFQSADVVTDEKGKTWIRLHIEGLSIPLFRNTKQAKSDLSNYIDAETCSLLQPLGFESAFNKHFRNKEIHLSASAYDIGSTYIVDENSSAYKNERAQLGEVLTAESAGIRIDGFLRAMLSEAENDAVYEAQLAYAREQADKVNSGTKFSIS